MKEEFTAILEDALQLTQAAHLPPNLEGIGFQKAIDYLIGSNSRSNKQLMSRAAAPAVNEPDVGSTSPLERIAQKLEVDLTRVEEIFSFDKDKGLELIVGARKVGSEMRPAMRLLAVLVAGGRQLGGLEEWTKLATVREVCDQYGKLDATNFSRVMNDLDSVFGYRGKAGSNREMRMNRAGWEELKTVITTLSSDVRSGQ
ncbi:MAG TPA: hypothetical protein VJS64_15150 [Pyrinomonadaceae bacterium]|nr:hypothetical protein [Pyrinomonadaceae bacterium]